MSLSPRDVRRLFLDRQGLLRDAPFGRGRDATLRAIERLGYVQIDTIAVMDRAHHHVLKTRVPGYDEAMLHRLQAADRTVFEYWAHAAAYLPMSAYRFSLPMMAGFSRRALPNRKLAAKILARIRAEGPLQSRHFEAPRRRKTTGWWDWKPAKRLLEYLFLRGDLMVARRDGFQKVYDLPERVLPSHVDTTPPTHAEWCRHVALTMTRALGAATATDVAYARGTIRKFTGKQVAGDLARALKALAEAGDVVELTSDGETVYATPEALARLPIRLGRKRLRFLSPFDNLVVNRARARRLFAFDYQVECYVPQPKRRHGYYCLPILWGDELIGRLDAKAVRAEGRLDAHLLQLEPTVKPDAALVAALREGLTRLARAHGCRTTRIAKTEPGKLRLALTV